MEIRGSVVVVTGAALGIGAALARRFAAEGAAGVAVCDLDGDDAAAVATEIGERTDAKAIPVTADITIEADVRALVERTESELGPIDLFCSNAGIATGLGLGAPDEWWEAAWAVNVLAHLYAARAVVPRMLERGHGYLLQTCSAAGVLIQPGDAPYSVTKHAAVAFAEWLALTYGDQGLRVSALCPQGVRTDLLMTGLATGTAAAKAVIAAGALLEPEDVAAAAVEGVRAERFLILPHPEVAELMRRKADDPGRWLAGIGRLVAMLGAQQPT
ncbi:MAG TPA: SDR family oxidoreductase [Mycobacteriales bacterium]|nr:SDR family oxidoreductase [Mycobacteriales bacterium]